MRELNQVELDMDIEADTSLYAAREGVLHLQAVIGGNAPSIVFYEQEIEKAERGEYSLGEGESDWLKTQCETAGGWMSAEMARLGIEAQAPSFTYPAFQTAKTNHDLAVSPFQILIDPAEIAGYIEGHRSNLSEVKRVFAAIENELMVQQGQLDD